MSGTRIGRLVLLIPPVRAHQHVETRYEKRTANFAWMITFASICLLFVFEYTLKRLFLAITSLFEGNGNLEEECAIPPIDIFFP